MTKTIGVLTSGGDCAGLNAAIRAVTLRAIHKYGWRVIGIKHSIFGLLKTPYDIVELTPANCGPEMLRAGGTILGSISRGDPFYHIDAAGNRVESAPMIMAAIKDLGIEAIIGIGGDGSFKIHSELAAKCGINFIGIPKTIDNDLGLTEYAIGFNTAVDVATEALDRLQPTAASHERVMILEVMGRDAGHIALTCGITGGADVVLIPEIPYALDKICAKIRQVMQQKAHNFALVVVAEAVRMESGQPVISKDIEGRTRYGGISQYLADKIQECTGAETRAMILGHVQRGGEPSPIDRLLGSAFGVHAVDLVAAGTFNRMVAWQNRRVIDIPLESAIATYSNVDPASDLVRVARGLGISFGDEE